MRHNIMVLADATLPSDAANCGGIYQDAALGTGGLDRWVVIVTGHGKWPPVSEVTSEHLSSGPSDLHGDASPLLYLRKVKQTLEHTFTGNYFLDVRRSMEPLPFHKVVICSYSDEKRSCADPLIFLSIHRNFGFPRR